MVLRPRTTSGGLAVGSKPARASLITEVTLRTRGAATAEEHPSRLATRRGGPARTQRGEVVLDSECLRLVAGPHLVQKVKGGRERGGRRGGGEGSAHLAFRAIVLEGEEIANPFSFLKTETFPLFSVNHSH